MPTGTPAPQKGPVPAVLFVQVVVDANGRMQFKSNVEDPLILWNLLADAASVAAKTALQKREQARPRVERAPAAALDLLRGG
jgi:hypothetical protein